MDATRSPFLIGALAWIGNGTIRDRCDACPFEWTMQPAAAVDAIEAAPDRYAALLADRDGMVAPDDGGWNATAYVWHLTDLARSWSERWVQIRELDHATPFEHGDWGAGTIADGLRWLAHEYVHHQIDVDARAR